MNEPQTPAPEEENRDEPVEETGEAKPEPQREAPREEAVEPETVTIALDAMGGDNAPADIVEGAVVGVRAMENVRVVLVGDEEAVRAELEKHHDPTGRVGVRHAEEAVAMDESPAAAIRKKKKSSIHVGMRMVSDGEADAFISAGNTGAVMAAATLILRNIEGIDRAAIAVPLPTQKGATVLLDAGANVVCKAMNLYQFGVMGSEYARYVLDAKYPRVGLLSIGEEETKGNKVTLEAFELLTKSSTNFIGNTEAKLLYRGVADVVVCDGFTGNIALKISESVAEMIGVFLKDVFTRNWVSKLAYAMLRSGMEEFKKKVDHSEVGGAPLLGIDGAVFISHGSSGPKSIKSALVAADKFVRENVNGHIRESLAQNEDIMAARDGRAEGIWSQVKRKMGLGHQSPEPEQQ